jgi:hypothetical protein
MPVTFTGSPVSYPAAISGPAPGDAVTAISVTDGDTLLADRTEWLRDQIDGRGVLIDTTVARSAVLDTGVISLQDMKSVTTWTDIPGVTATGGVTIENGDKFLVSIVCHVRHKVEDPVQTLLRAVGTYSLGGGAGDVSACTRRVVGHPTAAVDMGFAPVEFQTVIAIPSVGTVAGAFSARLQGMLTTAALGGSDEIVIASPWEIRLLHFRFPVSGV